MEKTDVSLPKEGVAAAEDDKQEAKKSKQDKKKPTKQKSQPEKDKRKSPFRKARGNGRRRVKALFWGNTGSGKTSLALQFPNPVVIDLEAGTVIYEGNYDFDVLEWTEATLIDDVMESIHWLKTNKHDFRTLIIDPITILWEALQKKWKDTFLRRKQSGKGFKFDFYELQPGDWSTIKDEWKLLLRRLVDLDMNIIVTARMKDKYAEGTGDMMRKIGDTFDGEKSLPYLFDIVMKLEEKDGKHLATVTGPGLKDRSGKLPRGPFETNYKVFESVFGESINKKSKVVDMITSDQDARIRRAIDLLNIDSHKVIQRLREYGATKLSDLTSDDAEKIANKLEAAMAEMVTASDQEKEA